MGGGRRGCERERPGPHVRRGTVRAGSGSGASYVSVKVPSRSGRGTVCPVRQVARTATESLLK